MRETVNECKSFDEFNPKVQFQSLMNQMNNSNSLIDFKNIQNDPILVDMAKEMAAKQMLFFDDNNFNSKSINIDFKKVETEEAAKDYIKLERDEDYILYCKYLIDKMATCSGKYQKEIDKKYS